MANHYLDRDGLEYYHRGLLNIIAESGGSGNSPFEPGEGENSAVLKNGNNTASGQLSVAEGDSTYASGDVSHAEGYYTTAKGNRSHAEGERTTASGSGSHAEGLSTYTYGIGSHAEGSTTSSFGDYSHAEGGLTSAYGKYAHAEGESTSTYGWGAHAEGTFTYAGADHTHAEGAHTYAFSADSHAEGNATSAYGFVSHAEGKNTYASGGQSHAEGLVCYALGSCSHVEGQNNISNGANSHSEGLNTTANGSNSHSEGLNTYAKGHQSHAEGYNQTVNNENYKYQIEDCGAYPFNGVYFIPGQSGVAGRVYNYSEEGMSIKIKYAYITSIKSLAMSIDNTVDLDTFVICVSKTKSGTYTSYTIKKSEGTIVYTYANELSSAESNSYDTLEEYNAHINDSESVLPISGSYGQGSHSEGLSTYALSDNSHAEGQHTIASDEAQHAGGKANVESSGAVVIGNGTRDVRSNAALLDWNGDLKLNGDVYINCENNSAGGTKLMALPVFTETDNGKILGIVDGQLAWVEK